MTCAATCNPACNYKWTRNNQQVSVGQKLNFTSIKRQHQGNYRCTASNGIGTDQGDDVSIQVNCKYNQSFAERSKKVFVPHV